ncbi:hypothetical protein CU044_5062 [Streptomyces sp. L-9-10]|nr:hypothetical protein CU044_5062 [Streptomyces sp. L-9-10]
MHAGHGVPAPVVNWALTGRTSVIRCRCRPALSTMEVPSLLF